ncbi:MAG: 3-hydroxybutyrate dehydrogenase [Alphaproteobacteria bacterium]
MGALTGKNAIVTGSTSGIGLGIAEALADAGCNVMINGLRNPERIEEACGRLRERSGIESIYSSADMSKPDQIAEMVEDAKERFGSVDIMVNNAGIQYVEPIESFPPEKWDAIIAINLSAAFHTTRAVVPGMKDRGWGRVINIASAHALVASPYKSAYVAAKHGIAGLTKTAALEVAEDGITVNAIAPGYVLTPLVEKQIPDTAEARGMTEDEVVREVILDAQPTKEFVTVEQVAALAVYLCGDQAASINGAVLPIEGGWTAQ